jgi:hypothetical protein
MITPITLKSRIQEETSRLKVFKFPEGQDVVEFEKSDSMYVFDCTIKKLNSTDGVEYFLIGKVEKIGDMGDLAEIFMSHVLFAWDAETGVVTDHDLPKEKTDGTMFWVVSKNSVFKCKNIKKAVTNLSKEIIQLIFVR